MTEPTPSPQDRDRDASPREVAAEVGRALVGRDLLTPAPPLWPFGARARQYRAARHAVRLRAEQRRHRLREQWDAQHAVPPTGTRWYPVVDRRANRRVLATLVLTVAAVLAGAWWAGQNTPPPHPPVPPPAPAGLSARPPAPATPPTPTSRPGMSLPAVPPIPPGGVAPLPPPSHAPQDPSGLMLVPPPPAAPTSTELATPESAAVAWLSRWCPFDYRAPLGTSEQRARPAMTPAGWDSLDPTRDSDAQQSWQTTVDARESGQCTTTTALLSPEAPRSDTSAVVVVSAARVVTGASAPPYVEPVHEQRLVVRGTDGLWRVDIPTRGG